MLLFLVGHATTPDKIKVITSAAATLDVVASYIDCSDASPPVPDAPNKQCTPITTATTTDVLAGVANAAKRRNCKGLNIRNKHASLATDVTVVLDAIDGNDYELHKVNLAAGEALEFVEGVGFFTLRPAAKLNKMLVTTADVINATTSFADITGLTAAVESGKTYAILAGLIAANDAASTGSRFGFNGPAMTYVVAGETQTTLFSVTAPTFGSGVVTALETAIVATTAGGTANKPTIIQGTIVPSAAGTFAMRCASEVAVAAGLTVRRGSWLRIREAD